MGNIYPAPSVDVPPTHGWSIFIWELEPREMLWYFGGSMKKKRRRKSNANWTELNWSFSIQAVFMLIFLYWFWSRFTILHISSKCVSSLIRSGLLVRLFELNCHKPITSPSRLSQIINKHKWTKYSEWMNLLTIKTFHFLPKSIRSICDLQTIQQLKIYETRNNIESIFSLETKLSYKMISFHSSIYSKCFKSVKNNKMKHNANESTPQK